MTIGSKKIYQVSDFPIRKDTGRVDNRFQNLTGQRFGRLTAVSFWGKGSGRLSYWNCICDCGNTSIIQAGNLKIGKTTSCGCYMKEVNTTHGMSDHPLYNVWDNMNRRCNNPNHKFYHNYGGYIDKETGLPNPSKVCWEWHQDNPDGCKNFVNYIENVMPIPSYEKYQSGFPIWTLDKINPFGDYEPDNVQWATMTEQQNNKKRHHDSVSA